MGVKDSAARSYCGKAESLLAQKQLACGTSLRAAGPQIFVFLGKPFAQTLGTIALKTC